MSGTTGGSYLLYEMRVMSVVRQLCHVCGTTDGSCMRYDRWVISVVRKMGHVCGTTVRSCLLCTITYILPSAPSCSRHSSFYMMHVQIGTFDSMQYEYTTRHEKYNDVDFCATLGNRDQSKNSGPQMNTEWTTYIWWPWKYECCEFPLFILNDTRNNALLMTYFTLIEDLVQIFDDVPHTYWWCTTRLENASHTCWWRTTHLLMTYHSHWWRTTHLLMTYHTIIDDNHTSIDDVPHLLVTYHTPINDIPHLLMTYPTYWWRTTHVLLT